MNRATSVRPLRRPAGPARASAFRALARAVSWHRRKLAVIAAVAAVLSGISATLPARAPTVEVVRTRAQLGGGVVLSRSDLFLDHVPPGTRPAGAIDDLDQLVGRTLAVPVAEGQMLTPLALSGSPAAVAPGHVLAPLRLADADLARLLRPGDRIDVVGASERSGSAKVVAAAARVVSVPPPPGGRDTPVDGALVLVDVGQAEAAALARAAVSMTLSVIWR